VEFKTSIWGIDIYLGRVTAIGMSWVKLRLHSSMSVKHYNSNMKTFLTNVISEAMVPEISCSTNPIHRDKVLDEQTGFTAINLT
jgi:hypothetical protein